MTSGPDAYAPDTDAAAPCVERVYGAMIAGLLEGKYRPGQRIRDRHIAEEYGVSRTPARDAIGRLQSRGLLESAPGGLAVRTLSPAEVVELYAVRQILEGSAARFAAQHASDIEIAAMEHFLAAFSAQTGDPKAQARINRQLHAAIREAAHNRFLANTLAELDITLALFPGTTYEVSGRADHAHSEHCAIVDAIKARDADAAEAAARHHIQQAQRTRLWISSRAG
jgi:DNA-binding GntR family transcriptional regulator